jgi:serine/threonine-protein kinase
MDQALVDVNGKLTWRSANLGSPNSPGGPGWFVLQAGQPYHFDGWTAQTDGGGQFTFTNDATGHGMKITWVDLGTVSHPEVATF